MTNPQTPDPWLAGQPYEQFMGRWSRQMATRFLQWLAPAPELTWLDLGCGTGALSEAILMEAAPASVLAVDPSEAYIAFARERLTDPRITFHVGDALNAPAGAGSIDVAASGLALNFIPEPAPALEAVRRAMKSGGTIGAYVWDYADMMQMLRYFWASAATLDPQGAALDEGMRFAICHPGALRQALSEAGFHDVEAAPLEIDMKFTNFEAYWSPFLLGQGPAGGYVAKLTEDEREALRDQLRGTLPLENDGSINLIARAWAARGVRA